MRSGSARERMVSSPAMPLVKPFRALRYDARVAGPLDDLVAPPYDVIPSEGLETLFSRNSYNVIRLIRPHESELAARRLAEWIETGVLVREERPAIWRIEEEYVGPDGIGRTRHGLVARVALEPYERGVVLPHERIFAAPAETRLRLLRATRTKLSPVLMLHDGAPPPPVDGPPDLEASLDGTTTRLWRVDEPGEVAALAGTVGPPLVIADGHHRYEAARRFHLEDGGEGTSHVMSVLVSQADDGLTIFPTHRLVSGPVPELNGAFTLTRLDGGAREGVERLGALPREHPAFVVLRPGETVLAQLERHGQEPLERLDVSALDRLSLEGVSFTPYLSEVEAALRSGAAAAAFLVRAPTVAEVRSIARAGRTMPEKSTYFHPKLASGLLLSPFDE